MSQDTSTEQICSNCSRRPGRRHEIGNGIVIYCEVCAEMIRRRIAKYGTSYPSPRDIEDNT